jgi:hypothetical protein
MTAINARLAYPLSLRERRDPPSASDSWPSHGCVTMEIDRMTPEELNDAIRPMRSAFLAEVCMPGCGGTA